MVTSLATEFAIIDAEHKIYTEQKAEIKFLRLTIKAMSGKLTFADAKELADIQEKYPHFYPHDFTVENMKA